ncbi:hypothetical protein LMG6871_02480 [Ralstonia edaphis]|uniref:hypothetical protein n=1 Tax=Ralstonia edaphi TaxID=3058599 RepID=UPI0028F5037E|nr:hypothetical protein [Ralstonia sp. LMG 6871]CAJ0718506.1 hypothetical protein LMG6871_02480 [Ralstonia sp. LMG 6871]
MQSHTPSAVRLVDNRRGRISLQYLEEAQQHRVRTSIRAIAARSLYQWDEAEPHQADVLVLEGDQADVRAAGPFKLWLGQPAPDVLGDDVFSLPRAFSTPMLWGVLDLIALRLMDSRRQPIEAGSASFIQTDTATANATANATGNAPDITTTDKPAYRLLRPVTLDAHLSQPRFRVAMDGMTARPVSLDELVHHGALELEEARLLLRTLKERGALEICVGSQTNPTMAPVQPLHAGPAHAGPPPDGWLSRARRWLHGRAGQ